MNRRGFQLNWLLRRLREPSTWRGLVWLATVSGLSLRPDQAEAIVTVGMALAGLLGVFLRDEPKTVRIELPPIDLQSRPESGDAPADPRPVRPADELRLQADRRPGPTASADPNTYPRFGSGFGDRD